jgi:hypothetical protein
MTYARPMSESDAGHQDELAALLDEFQRVYLVASDLIRGMGDPRSAYDAGTRLTKALRDLADNAAALRGEAVNTIWKTEELSLAALANSLGISKSRANQLVQPAKKEKEEGA